MFRAVFLALMLLNGGTILKAQSLRFKVNFGTDSLKLNSTELLNNHDSIRIELLRFYIGHIQLYHKNQLVWEDSGYHLLDVSDPGSMSIAGPNEAVATEILFMLGTDSLTNVSGAMSGDLDPSLGMYWAWNSGYINFKLEGSTPICNTRNNAFQLHLGGYASPNASAQLVQLPYPKNHIIELDLKAFLNAFDLSQSHSIMSPSTNAVKLMRHVAASFRVSNNE